jgi:hypothetical protein
MSTRHHHRWVLRGSLFLAYRASEYAVKSQVIRKRNFYWELILLAPFSAFRIHNCNYFDNGWQCHCTDQNTEILFSKGMTGMQSNDGRTNYYLIYNGESALMSSNAQKSL